MSKLFKWLPVIAAVVLLSGLTPSTIHASASMGGDEQQSQEGYESNWHQDRGHNFYDFLHNYFKDWQYSWHHNVEKPNYETPEQPETDVEVPVPQPPKTDEEKSNDNNQGESNELNQFEEQVVELTNQERQKQGLQPLKIDNALSKVAREKSLDIENNNYFGHNSPTYGSPFDMMDSFGIDYRIAGENIAQGQRSPEEVVDAWMNSAGHRENIMDGSFTHIGVGYVEQKNTWTQQFIGK